MESKSSTPPEKPLRVLLVEDSPAYVYIIRDMLLRQSASGFSLRSAESQAEALRVLQAEAADVILLDLGLPDSEGYETFAQVYAVASHIPIIILTALDDESLAMRAVRQGAQDFLVKEQVDKNLLIRSIRYAIERYKADEALRDLSGRLLRLQDEERQRIARELHDVTAQNLAALNMNLCLLKGFLAETQERPREILADCQASAEKCSQELRTLSYLLHAPLLEELGLAGAVRDYADGFSSRSGIRVDLEVPPDFPRLSQDQERVLFRILQEGLNNVHRHSGSATASIRLWRDTNQIVLELQDSGRGVPKSIAALDAGAGGLGVGILGMRERLRQFGGKLEITSGNGHGTLIRALLPGAA